MDGASPVLGSVTRKSRNATPDGHAIVMGAVTAVVVVAKTPDISD